MLTDADVWIQRVKQEILEQYELMHASDFSNPSRFWLEESTPAHRFYRRDGYYHIAVLDGGIHYVYPVLPLSDFTVYVNAQFTNPVDVRSECGILFRRNQDNYYLFSISPSGYCQLAAYLNNKWEYLSDWRSSKFIKRKDSKNTLMVSAIGQRILAKVNGHLVTSLEDYKLLEGSVGLAVTAYDSFAEVKFRDYRLYKGMVDIPDEAGIYSLSP
jgi:hypothetical protein